MPNRFAGLVLAVSITALSACDNADGLKNLVQLKELSPDDAVALAALPFDPGAPITVRGRVTTMFFGQERPGMIAVHAIAGTERYVFTTGSTPDLAKQGFSRFTLKPGEEITVTGILAKDGQKIEGFTAAKGTTLQMPDGRTVSLKSGKDS